jgi:hypothetical protein
MTTNEQPRKGEHLIHNRYEDSPEPLPAGADPGSDGLGVTCVRMDGDHLAHGYARVGMGCITDVPQDMSAHGVPEVEQQPAAPSIAEDVAALRNALLDLRDDIKTLGMTAAPHAQITHRHAQDLHTSIVERLDRIATQAPQPTRVWMHRCGVVLINDEQPPPCHVCVSTPQIPFQRLYTLGDQ